MSQREEILALAAPIEPLELDIPEFGGRFKLLPLNGAQVEEISLLAEQARATGNYLCLRGMRGRVAVWTVADVNGQRVFKPADAQQLTEKFPAVLTRLFDQVKRHNGLTEDAAEAIEKN